MDCKFAHWFVWVTGFDLIIVLDIRELERQIKRQSNRWASASLRASAGGEAGAQ